MPQTTITVDESTLERFKATKRSLDAEQDGVPDHSADSFLNALLDTWEAAGDGYYTDPSAEAIVEELETRIDTLAFDGAVSESEAERIIGRLEDLEAQLPRKVAEELQQ
jgi:hypothetical protein